jgi:hypothetical protein
MKINQFIRTIFIVCLAITGVFTDSSHAKQKDKMNVKKEFFKAVTEGDTAKVKTLLRKDSSLASVVDEKGTSALLKAVYYGKKPIVDL